MRGVDLAGFASRVGAEPLDVDVAFSAATAAVARHGLGKAYVGGYCIGVSAAHSQAIMVATPEATAASGYDPAVYVVVLAGTAAYTGTARIRMVV